MLKIRHLNFSLPGEKTPSAIPNLGKQRISNGRTLSENSDSKNSFEHPSQRLLGWLTDFSIAARSTSLALEPPRNTACVNSDGLL